MLQQTQTSRVGPKYELFIKRFPHFPALADARLKDVLTIWQGLGYNRRALYLKQTAEIIVNQFLGNAPKTMDELTRLPGIGKATAGAIAAYVFGQPVVFIETNIRAVFLHFFFRGKTNVSDNEIMPLVEQTVDIADPRTWYYALTDYGAMLKIKERFRNTASKHYIKQSRFEGSNRQIRGAIIRILAKNSSSLPKLLQVLTIEKEKLTCILAKLQQDRLIVKKNNQYHISS